MKINSVTIKNFKGIKNSGEIIFSDRLYVLAGQNESGKSSILEAIEAYENEDFEKDNLNFEEEQGGNVKQEISCIYEIENINEFTQGLKEELKKSFSLDEEDDFFDISRFEKLKKFTTTKSFDHQNGLLTPKVDKIALGILKSAIKNKEKIETDKSSKETKTKVPYLSIDESNEQKIAEIFFSLAPKIILFNDFSDLLPDKILVSDLESKNEKAQGYQAVRNLETLLSKNLVEISKLSTAHKNSIISKEAESLSVTFQKDWRQKIYGNNKVKIKFHIENDNVGGKAVPTVFFYVETKDNVPLEPRKRSKGMIWFLSAWLELKAKENEQGLVILYDEPGLHLHIKAHKDMFGIFEFLTKEKGHQIIYSTHSPSLINTASLHNIGLVINTENKGTIVEGLTTSEINTDYKKDALQPVAEAMGLGSLKDFNILSKKNVLIEGLSDFWYFSGMQKALNRGSDYKFVPGIGIKNGKINHLISFCVGYGLDWLLIMDDGKNSQDSKKELKERVFNNNEDELNKKVKILSGYEDIEKMFEASDLLLLDKQIQVSGGRPKISDNRKIILARNFMIKIEKKEITKSKLDPKTIKRFSDIFDWIEERFKK